jgi:hypothetical protein
VAGRASDWHCTSACTLAFLKEREKRKTLALRKKTRKVLGTLLATLHSGKKKALAAFSGIAGILLRERNILVRGNISGRSDCIFRRLYGWRAAVR